MPPERCQVGEFVHLYGLGIVNMMPHPCEAMVSARTSVRSIDITDPFSEVAISIRTFSSPRVCGWLLAYFPIWTSISFGRFRCFSPRLASTPPMRLSGSIIDSALLSFRTWRLPLSLRHVHMACFVLLRSDSPYPSSYVKSRAPALCLSTSSDNPAILCTPNTIHGATSRHPITPTWRSHFTL